MEKISRTIASIEISLKITMLAILPNVSLDQIIEIVAASSLGTLAVQWVAKHLDDALNAVTDAIRGWALTRRGEIVSRIVNAVYQATKDGRIDEGEAELFLSKLGQIFPRSNDDVINSEV